MGRALRTNIENGWYHVMGRGLDSRGLFADDRDREHFKELLGEVHERYRFVIDAWVQMDTHYHLLLQTPDADLSAGAGEQFMSRRGDWGRPLVLHLARRFCGMTLRDIGERAGGMDYAAVSVMLKRLALRVQKDRKLRSILNRASGLLNVETRHQ